MPERPDPNFRPALEPLEGRRALSGASAAAAHGGKAVHAQAVERKPEAGYLLYRITNPDRYNNRLVPPFTHFLVQASRPIPGQTYNILQVSVRNGTSKTFGATSPFFVRFPGQAKTYPILTGQQTWKPGQIFVFYVLSKQYYPLPSQVHSGFEFSLDGARSVAIPGPSGIIQRIKYNPATFDKILDHYVAFGPGAQGGVGPKYGLPDTSINEFVDARTNRNDFGGYF